jgi:hypothetical protein
MAPAPVPPPSRDPRDKRDSRDEGESGPAARGRPDAGESLGGALSVQPTLSQVSQLPPLAQAGPRAARTGLSRGLRRPRLTGGVFKARLMLGTLMALLFTGLLWGAQNAIARAWSAQLLWWLRSLDLLGTTAATSAAKAANAANAVNAANATSSAAAVPAANSLFALPLPTLDLLPPDMGLPSLLVHALATLVLWVVAGWWPDRARPLALWMRCAALLHGAAIAYFFIWPASFAHAVADHVFSVLRLGWWLLLLTPWLHLAIYYLFPFALWQRVALTGLSLLYLLLATPLQAASHAALLHVLGPVTMPLLHLLLGVVWPVMALVALYAWAMSWGGGADVAAASSAEAATEGAATGMAAPSTAMPTLSQSLPPRL